MRVVVTNAGSSGPTMRMEAMGDDGQWREVDASTFEKRIGIRPVLITNCETGETRTEWWPVADRAFWR